MQRIPLLLVLVALGAVASPAAAPAAPTTADGEDAIVVISGDVTVPRGETVEGVFVASGDVRVDGRVDGDVVLFAGDAVVSGRIDGNLVTFGGEARLLASAHVTGDVSYGDERPTVSGDAIVKGDVTEADWPDGGDLVPFVGFFFLWLAVGVSAAILGALLILIAPRAADAIAARARGRIGPLIAIGLAIAIALPVAGGIAAVTLVGLPLAFAILLALLPLAAIAYVASAYALGRAVVKAPRKRIWSFLAGLAILRAAALVPLLGFFVGVAAVVFGFGLLGAAIGAAREPQAEPARSPDS
ncbi:MAG TPA: polymer-forming cytoskeletal protein [Solirubrobacterales bacterium]|nr:polymer-forming cytoskeletal protein [Solirubrobacterales bacterium]